MSSHNNRHLEARYSRQAPPTKSGEAISRQHTPIQQQSVPRTVFYQMADNQKLDQRFQPQGEPGIPTSICLQTPQIQNLQPAPMASTQQPPPPQQQQQQPSLPPQAHHQFKSYTQHQRNPPPRHSVNRGYQGHYGAQGVQIRHQIDPNVRYMHPLGYVQPSTYPFFMPQIMTQQMAPMQRPTIPVHHQAHTHEIQSVHVVPNDGYIQNIGNQPYNQAMYQRITAQPPQQPGGVSQFTPQPPPQQMQQPPPQQKTTLVKRIPKMAILQDPETNRELDINSLAKEPTTVNANATSSDVHKHTHHPQEANSFENTPKTAVIEPAKQELESKTTTSKKSLTTSSESSISTTATSNVVKTEPVAVETRRPSISKASVPTTSSESIVSSVTESKDVKNQLSESKPTPLHTSSTATLTQTSTSHTETQSKLSKPEVSQSEIVPAASELCSSLNKSRQETVVPLVSSAKPASAPIPDKPRHINSSPPEAKTAEQTSSPATTGSVSSTAHVSATFSPNLPQTRSEDKPLLDSKPSAVSTGAATIVQPEQNHVAETKPVGDDVRSPNHIDSKPVSSGEDKPDRIEPVPSFGQIEPVFSKSIQKPIIKESVHVNDEITTRQFSARPDDSQRVDGDTSTLSTTHREFPAKRSASEEAKPDKYSYDANFLKKLQFNSLSVQKPDLPPLEIVLDQPNRNQPKPNRPGKPNDFDAFCPSFLNIGPPSQRPGRNSMQGGRMHMSQEGNKPRKIISTSLSQEVKLRTTENAWKPLANKKDGQSEEDKTRELLKKARGLLNKLTPDNYERILNQLRELELNTRDRLAKMIDLLFDKAIDEPAFCVQYANVCQAMNTYTVPDGDNGNVRFGKLLVQKCQTMFEGDIYKDIDLSKREEAIQICGNRDKKRQLIDEFDEEKRQARKKCLGNIKLIGELNRIGMLNSKIMLFCIDQLLRFADDDSYECLCTLLRTIGQGLEAQIPPEYKQTYNGYIHSLREVVKQSKPSSRIKFMILDLLELRDNKWIPRKTQDNKPKTIKEIHSDARKKEQQDAMQRRSGANERERDRDREFNAKMEYTRQRADGQLPPGCAPRKSQTSRDVSGMFKKMSSSMSNSGTNLTLGDRSKFSWGTGARNQANSSSKESPTSGPNRYEGSSTGSRDRWIRPGTGSSGGPSTSIEQTKTSPEDGDFKTFGTKGSRIRDSPPAIIRLDAKRIAQKLDNFLIEHGEEAVDELRQDLRQIHPEDQKSLASAAISKAMEKTSTQPVIAQLLSIMFVNSGNLPAETLVEVLKTPLEEAEGELMDVPRIYEYYGILLSKIFLDISDNERRDLFIHTLEPCKVNDKSIVIMQHVILNAVKLSSKEEVAKKWSVSGLSWHDFSEKSTTIESLRNHKDLDFINNVNGSRSSFSSELKKKVDEICAQIRQHHLTNHVDKEEENKFDEKMLGELRFQPQISCALLPIFLERAHEQMLESQSRSKDQDNGTEGFKIFDTYCQVLPQSDENDLAYQKKLLDIVLEFDTQKERPKDLLGFAIDALYSNFTIHKAALFDWYNGLTNPVVKNLLSKLIESIKKEQDSESPNV